MKSIALYQNPLNATFVGDDEFLIYNLPTGKLHRFNDSAVLVIELCDGSRSVDDIAELLGTVQSFNTAKCKQWIETAVAEQLLISDNFRQIHKSDSVTDDLAKRFAGQAGQLRDEGLILAAFVCQNQAAMLQSENPEYWLGLGELAHILGRRKNARQAYERYLDLCPDNAEARHILMALSDQKAPERAPDECILQLYSRFSEFYEDNMRGDLEYEAPERMQEHLERYLERGENLRVLELGCGTGLAGAVIRSYAGHLAGVDLSPEMVAKCQEQDALYDALHVAEITSFLEDQIVKDVSYDLIVACDTFIYFGDLAQVIGPASKLLTPNGKLVFTVEKGDMAPFKLTDSGRYSHASSHIRSVASNSNLNVIHLEEGFLRYEYGEPVAGWVATLGI